MLNGLTNWMRRLFRSKPQEAECDSARFSEKQSSDDKNITAFAEEDITVVPYDENLLERARTQWQFGDWESLAKVERSSLQHHPDRAKLALLVAAGHAQLGNMPNARQFIGLAEDWGCSKRLISQVLISGVYNSLGRAAVIMGQEQRALSHFNQSVVLGASGSDTKLLTQARVMQQCRAIDTSPSRSLEFMQTITSN